MKNYLQTVWSNPNYRKSIMILIITCLWLASGVLRSDTPEAVSETKEVKRVTVKARELQALEYAPVVQVRARTEATRAVELKAEVSGRVLSLPVSEGDVVKQGDTICELAVEDRELRVNEARSAVQQAKLEYDGSLRLKSGGYQSRTAIAAAKARLDAAKANLKRSELNFQNTKVRAPFDGMVEKHHVEVGDFVDRGAACAMLLDLNPMTFVGRVSENEVERLQEGQNAKARLVGGRVVDAQLNFVGFESDQVTRTFRIEAVADNSDFSLRSGITTDLQIAVDKLRAQMIPSSLLSLDDQGRIGVRILDEENRVMFNLVQIVGDANNGVWVLGLPETVRLITVGQEYATSGAIVDVVMDGEANRGVAAAADGEQGDN